MNCKQNKSAATMICERTIHSKQDYTTLDLPGGTRQKKTQQNWGGKTKRNKITTSSTKRAVDNNDWERQMDTWMFFRQHPAASV